MKQSPLSRSHSHSHLSKRSVCSLAALCETPGLDPDPKARFSFPIDSQDFCPFSLHPASHLGCSFYDSAQTTLSSTSLCCNVTGDFPLRLCCLQRSQFCHRNPCCCFRIRSLSLTSINCPFPSCVNLSGVWPVFDAAAALIKSVSPIRS